MFGVEVTGHGESGSEDIWSFGASDVLELQKRAQENDPVAKAALNLLGKIELQKKELDEKLKEADEKQKQADKKIDGINLFIIGVLVFASVTFAITMFTLVRNDIADKSLYLQYNDVYSKYSEENIKNQGIINGQKLEIQDLNHKIEDIYNKNSYLK